jgi:hypothetical protein
MRAPFHGLAQGGDSEAAVIFLRAALHRPGELYLNFARPPPHVAAASVSPRATVGPGSQEDTLSDVRNKLAGPSTMVQHGPGGQACGHLDHRGALAAWAGASVSQGLSLLDRNAKREAKFQLILRSTWS